MITTPNYRRGGNPEIRISKFGGVDYSTVATEIADNKASDMENMMLDTQGMLQQVPGYRRLYEAYSSGTTPVRMLTRAIQGDLFLKFHGGTIYKVASNGTETVLQDTLTDAPMKDFIMGNYQYFFNGADFIRWDGSHSPQTVTDMAYAPTTVIGRQPTGGGTAFEAVNLLSPSRVNSFIGNGTATVFQLDTVGLDATPVSATVNGTAIAEGSGLTVNRTTGAVTFTTAPADGAGVDNVVIYFSKTVSGYADRIKKCKFFAIFGTGNNLRVFMSGNPDYKNQDWYSAMQDPTYFPDLNYTKIGSEGVAIKGYALLQGAMHILKESSTYDPTIWTRTIATESDGTIYFPVRPNNSSIGLLATESVKSINDICYMLTKQGIYRITSTYVSDERGLDHISGNIDAKLLKEENLDKAVAFDHEGKYGLAVNGKVYVIDYNNNGEAYIWNGYDASCFLQYGMDLYFGSSNSGKICRFNKFEDQDSTFDFDGEAISSYWYSKVFYMDRANYMKMIDEISVTLVPFTALASVDIYYSTERRLEKFIKRVSARTMDFRGVDFNNFSFEVSNLPQSLNRSLNIEDVVYFQIILKNSEKGVGMAISNITIPYFFVGKQ